MGRLTHSVSGNVATFKSADKSDITSLKVHFSPVQEGSGDPSPSNVRPITGWTGLTAYIGASDYKITYNTGTTTSYGVTFNVTNDGYITADGTPTSYSSCNYGYIDVDGTETIYGYIAGSLNNITWNKPALYNSNGTAITTSLSDSALTLGLDLSQFQDVKKVLIKLKRNVNDVKMSGGAYILIKKNTQAIPVTIQKTFDTVYGGYVDLITGNIVAEQIGRTFKGSDADQTTELTNTKKFRFRFYKALKGNGNTNAGITCCDKLKYMYSENDELHYYFTANNANGNAYVYLPKDFSNDDEITLVASLYTPEVVGTLTPVQLKALVGQNNIWSNTNGIAEVEYEFTDYLCRKHVSLNEPHIATATGTVANFNTDMKAPLTSLKATMKPVQNFDGSLPSESKNLLSPLVKGVTLDFTNGNAKHGNTSATSDFIAVDYTNNQSYYLSGLAYTIASFIAAYNSNKQFLGRTGGTTRSEIQLTSDVFTNGTPQGTGNIAYLRVMQYVSNTGFIDDIDNAKTQLEIGSSATTYIPYFTSCPVTGWTGTTISQTQKTLFEMSELSYQNNTQYVETTISGNTITVKAKGNGTSYLSTSQRGDLVIPEALRGKSVWFGVSSVTLTTASANHRATVICEFRDKNDALITDPTIISYSNNSNENTLARKFSIPYNAYSARFLFRIAQNVAQYNVVANDSVTYNDFYMRYPDTTYGYEAYNGSKIPVSWINWNQYIIDGTFTDASKWIPGNASYGAISVSNNVGTWTCTTTPTDYYTTGIAEKDNHLLIAEDQKVLLYAQVRSSVAADVSLYPLTNSNTHAVDFSKHVNANEWTEIYGIPNNRSSGKIITKGKVCYTYWGTGQSPVTVGTTLEVKNFMMFNLTRMFGAGNEPTADEFREQFSADYYAFDTGISSTGSAPIIYGGYIDPVKGELVATYKKVDLGDFNWSYYTYASSCSGGYTVGITDGETYGANTVPNAYCSALPITTDNDFNIDSSAPRSLTMNINSMVKVKIPNVTDSASVKAAVKGIKLVYLLKTPIVYQLTPQQIKSIVGTNNIWSTFNGNVEVKYWKH